jgi:hypothetical protein
MNILIENQFDFLSKEVITYLEIYLNIYCMEEKNKMNQLELENKLLYHFFTPFLTPEEFFYKDDTPIIQNPISKKPDISIKDNIKDEIINFFEIPNYI